MADVAHTSSSALRRQIAEPMNLGHRRQRESGECAERQRAPARVAATSERNGFGRRRRRASVWSVCTGPRAGPGRPRPSVGTDAVEAALDWPAGPDRRRRPARPAEAARRPPEVEPTTDDAAGGDHHHHARRPATGDDHHHGCRRRLRRRPAWRSAAAPGSGDERPRGAGPGRGHRRLQRVELAGGRRALQPRLPSRPAGTGASTRRTRGSSGSGRRPSGTRNRLRYVVLHELAHGWQYRQNRFAQFITDYGAWGFHTIGPALEAGADCVAAVWGANRGHYWNCPADARALAVRRLAGDWRLSPWARGPQLPGRS